MYRVIDVEDSYERVQGAVLSIDKAEAREAIAAYERLLESWPAYRIVGITWLAATQNPTVPGGAKILWARARNTMSSDPKKCT